MKKIKFDFYFQILFYVIFHWQLALNRKFRIKNIFHEKILVDVD